MKKTFYTEWAYVSGILILAFGAAMMERADFGLSMVVAPAYLLYRKISLILPWFTFGMAEYCFQGLLILLVSLMVGKFKRYFLFSFVTAVLYGAALDGMMLFTAILPCESLAARFLIFLIGMGCGSVGVSLLFHTYLAPEAYELFVKEAAQKFQADIHRVKTLYDCGSCLVAVILSFLFFGFLHFEGVKGGTFVCALVNGWCIGKCSRFMEKRYTFADGLPLRRYFCE